MNNEKELLGSVASIVDAVRKLSPLVHCMTNHVTVNDCANILLSAGASPAMIDSADEAYDFARISNALYINFGTYYKEQELASYAASLAAKQAGKPVVVDPVGCGAIKRRVMILEHIAQTSGVNMIKGNMGEIMALAGEEGLVKGVDSSGDIDGIEDAAKLLAKKNGCVVAATGACDVVTDGTRLVRLGNGSEMLTKITGSGCMVGALCGATAAAAPRDMFGAAIAGISILSIAGELAAEKTQLPGSFRTALIDAVYELDGNTVQARGKLTVK